MSNIEFQRLSKVLAAAGVASRRACEQLIFEGRVKVNGKVCLIPQTGVSLQNDDIRFDNIAIEKKQDKVYLLLNKPVGYICSNARVGSKKIVLDLFEGFSERLFTVGRLDRETSGLLIVTNDGHFAQSVIHPSANIEKEYVVKTEQEITDSHLKIISRGTLVEEKWVTPVRVQKQRRGCVKVVVKEGRKREVRTLIEIAGLTILSLERIRIGGLLLGSIKPGHYREMNDRDKRALFA